MASWKDVLGPSPSAAAQWACFDDHGIRSVFAVVIAAGTLTCAAVALFIFALLRSVPSPCRSCCGSRDGAAPQPDEHASLMPRTTTGEVHGPELEGGASLAVFALLIGLDGCSGLKHVADGILTVAVASPRNLHKTGTPSCTAFGTVEAFFTLTRAFVGIVYWLHVGSVVWDFQGLLASKRAVATAIAVSLVAGLLLTGAAAAPWALDTIGRKPLETWCWVENNTYRWFMADAWYMAQGALAVWALLCPLASSWRRRAWGKSFVRVIVWRWAVCIPFALSLLVIVIAEAQAHKGCRWRTAAAYVSATLIPMRGVADVMIFFLSEPLLMRQTAAALTPGTCGGAPLQQVDGFGRALDAIKDKNADRRASSGRPSPSDKTLPTVRANTSGLANLSQFARDGAVSESTPSRQSTEEDARFILV
jgi:hypothetical protein